MKKVYQNIALESTPKQGFHSCGIQLLFSAHPYNCAISLKIPVRKIKNLLCSGTQEVFVRYFTKKILVMLFFNDKFDGIIIRLFSVTKQGNNGSCSKPGNPGNNKRHKHAFNL